MRDRGRHITKILSLFKQNNIQSLSDISGILVIAPSRAKDYCYDLIKSGMLLVDVEGDDPIYIATEKLLTMDNHIYEIMSEMFDDITELQDASDTSIKYQDLFCRMSVSGYCGEARKDVPCDGTELDKLRCFRWQNK
jgi:predicted transcriptional regulator